MLPGAAVQTANSALSPVEQAKRFAILPVSWEPSGDQEKARIDALLSELVTQTAPDLLTLHGVGVDTAASLLVTAGDNRGRLRSEAAWAHLCGTAPIPACSGKVTRWRLNRGGDRQANSALWGS